MKSPGWRSLGWGSSSGSEPRPQSPAGARSLDAIPMLAVGAGPMRATLALTRNITQELFEQGTYSAPGERDSLPELCKLLAGG